MSKGVFGAAGYEASLNGNDAAVEQADHMVTESSIVYGAEPIPRELTSSAIPSPKMRDADASRNHFAASVSRQPTPSRVRADARAGTRMDARADAYAQLRRVLHETHHEERYNATSIATAFDATPLDPPEIRHLVGMFRFSHDPERTEEFLEQAEYMADYEPKGTFDSSFNEFFPVYSDMTVSQLKGYFAWRTCIRHGDYVPTSSSTAYVYVYELLNGIGVQNMTDAYRRLNEFREHYVDQYDKSMAYYANSWLRDMVIAYDLPEECMREQFGAQISEDETYATLIQPQNRTAEQIVHALRSLSSYNASKSPLNKLVPQSSSNLTLYDRALAAAWLAIAADRDPAEPSSFFDNYIAMQHARPVSLFSTAVFSRTRAAARMPQGERRVSVDPACSYTYENKRWYINTYEPVAFQRTNMNNLLHEVDRVGRQIWHTGRALKPRGSHPPCSQIIKRALTELKTQLDREQWEREHPPIHVDLTRLSSIREAAAGTRDSLLTEAELEAEREAVTEDRTATEEVQTEKLCQSESQELQGLSEYGENALLKNAIHAEVTETIENSEMPENSGNSETDLQLSPDELLLLRALAAGEPPAEWKPKLLAKHLLPSVLAHSINEKVFDVVADSVLETDDNGDPALIEDYVPDVRGILANISE